MTLPHRRPLDAQKSSQNILVRRLNILGTRNSPQVEGDFVRPARARFGQNLESQRPDISFQLRTTYAVDPTFSRKTIPPQNSFNKCYGPEH